MLQNGDHESVRRKLQVPAKARGRTRNPDPAGETRRRARSHPDQDRALLNLLIKANPGDGGFKSGGVKSLNSDRTVIDTNLVR